MNVAGFLTETITVFVCYALTMYFFCVACLRPSKVRNGILGREGSNCFFCKATSRDRAMLLNIHLTFLQKLAKNPTRIPKIIGISDGYLMEKILTRVYKTNYKNYHYHQEPKLDVTKVPANLFASADIVSCSEVLEHVAPPINTAFQGLNLVLRKAGVLILSVPHTDEFQVHVEHFPVMKESRIEVYGEVSRLRGLNSDGEYLEFNDLVFHGGEGFTLEYRIFSETSLKSFLRENYFTNIHRNRNVIFFGIKWEPWSRVWKATKS